MFTFLHLSDLHRSPTDPISNSQLLATLVVDRDRYVNENPKIAPPDAIIISGDIIQGVDVDTAGWEGKIREQYDVAYNFLSELTVRFVDGDRGRVILVPGNHDVNWNVARSAMEPVIPSSEPHDIPSALFVPGSPFRWCWKTKRLFRIRDRVLYESRMDAFWAFFDRFYTGLRLTYPLGRSTGFNLFEVDRGRIAVAAFDSCSVNDCFACQGAIAAGAIAQSHLALRDSGRHYDLRIAVWHHSIQGPPHRTDYMDAEAVYEMIGCGYRVGLHGHQHRTEVTPYYIHLPERETMAVISGGSLCAGARELPRGINRQYNVIEIKNDFLGARIHVRTIMAATMFGPAPIHFFGGRSFVDMVWDRARDPYGRPVDESASRTHAAVLEAEAALHAGDFARVDLLLAEIRERLGQHGRRILIEAARLNGKWDELIAYTTPPRTIEELVFHAEACGRTRQYQRAQRALNDYGSKLGLPDPIRLEILGQLEAQAAIQP